MNEPDFVEQQITLPRWGGTIIQVIIFNGVAYYPLTHLCAVLGIAPQKQRDRIREHVVLGRMLRQFPMMTPGGRQMMWCIEERAIGFWLGTIQISAVRSEVRDKLLDFQEALVQAAYDLLRAVDTLPGVVGFARSLEARIGRLEERIFAPEEDA